MPANAIRCTFEIQLSILSLYCEIGFHVCVGWGVGAILVQWLYHYHCDVADMWITSWLHLCYNSNIEDKKKRVLAVSNETHAVCVGRVQGSVLMSWPMQPRTFQKRRWKLKTKMAMWRKSESLPTMWNRSTHRFTHACSPTPPHTPPPHTHAPPPPHTHTYTMQPQPTTMLSLVIEQKHETATTTTVDFTQATAMLPCKRNIVRTPMYSQFGTEHTAYTHTFCCAMLLFWLHPRVKQRNSKWP